MIPSITDASSQLGDSMKQFHKQPSIFKRTQKGENSARDPNESRKTPSQTVLEGPSSIQDQIRKADSQSRLSRQAHESVHQPGAFSERVDDLTKTGIFKPKLPIQDFDQTHKHGPETSRTNSVLHEGLSVKLANLITVMQTQFYKELSRPAQTTFKQLFDYAQRLECIIQEKDDEIQRLMFLNKYHYKIQEKKDHMYTKLVEQNRNIVEQNKKFSKTKKGFLTESKTAHSVRITRNGKFAKSTLEAFMPMPASQNPVPPAAQTAVTTSQVALSPKSQSRKMQPPSIPENSAVVAVGPLPPRSPSPPRMPSVRTEGPGSRSHRGSYLGSLNPQSTSGQAPFSSALAGTASPGNPQNQPNQPAVPATGTQSPAQTLPDSPIQQQHPKVPDLKLKIKRYEAKPTFMSRDVELFSHPEQGRISAP